MSTAETLSPLTHPANDPAQTGLVEITRDVTVNGDPFVARTLMMWELPLIDSPVIQQAIDEDLTASVRAQCKRRWGAGFLVRLSPDKFRWIATTAAVG